MSASQQLSRGFRRLALFLAAIPLLVGGIASTFAALDQASSAKRSHDQQVKLVCARTALKADPSADLPKRTPTDHKFDALDALEKRFGIRKVVIVADKGIASKVNLKSIKDKGYSYIFAYQLKSASDKIKEQVFSGGYNQIQDDDEPLRY